MAFSNLLSDRAVNPFSTATAECLVVFDQRVADLHLLYAALVPGAMGYTIAPNEDALVVITWLLSQTGATRLAIVAHGEPGIVHLGASPIDLAQVKARSGLLQEWGVAEIALYACEVGADAGFVQALGQATGAAVFAASQKVGAAAQGGSWVLEDQSGDRIVNSPRDCKRFCVKGSKVRSNELNLRTLNP